MTAPRSTPALKPRPWLWVVIAAALALSIGFGLSHRTEGSLQVRWSLRDFGLGAYERRLRLQVRTNGNPETVTVITKGFCLGPLNVFRMRSETDRTPRISAEKAAGQ